jgi:hypothetical protein
MRIALIYLALMFLLVADLVRWKIVVGRELKRRGLVRVRTGGYLSRITLAKGYRLIEHCICERQGKKYDVLITNRGWLRTQLSIGIVEM